MAKKKTSGGGGDYNGFLWPRCHVKGELRFEDAFRIDGKLTGTIISDGELIVGEGGEVDGEVQVRRLYVLGTVRGTLKVSERIDVTSSGKVIADLYTPSLKIEEGAFFEGRCRMDDHAEASSAKNPAPDNVTKMPMAKG